MALREAVGAVSRSALAYGSIECQAALRCCARACSTSAGATADFGYKEVPRGEKETLVGKVFSSVAPKYDVMNDVMSGGLHRLWKDKFVSMLDPAPGIHHLDVAGGTGDIAFRVLKRMRRDQTPAPGKVTVLDINREMIEQGKRRAGERKLDGPDLDWIVDSAEKLPLPDASCDSYTIAFGIRNVTNRDAALREAVRVLKPGGRFMCLEFSQVETPVLKELYDAYSVNVIPNIGKIIADDGDSYQYLVESIRRFPDMVSFAEEVQDAGLRFVDYKSLSGGVVAIHWGYKL